MRKIFAAACVLAIAALAVPALAADVSPTQSKIDASVKKQTYPKVVLYSVAWCPHCKEAKEYFTAKNIPFINKDVELDATAMEELTKKYKSQGVPVIIIGNDKVLKGFSPDAFEKAVKEVQSKK
ncbi:NrdH-redoxin [Geobacter anodireducens]|nr:NrdH-redoxin [Geobacter anodireducens]HMN02669.1 glutaredoxin domain-containing protein [Geobacter anodireducens]